MLVDVDAVRRGACVNQMEERQENGLDTHLGRVCIQLGSLLEVLVLCEVPGAAGHVCYDNTQLLNPCDHHGESRKDFQQDQARECPVKERIPQRSEQTFTSPESFSPLEPCR